MSQKCAPFEIAQQSSTLPWCPDSRDARSSVKKRGKFTNEFAAGQTWRSPVTQGNCMNAASRRDKVHRGPTGRENLDHAAVPGLRCAPSWAIFASSLTGGKEQMTWRTRRKEQNSTTEDIHAIALTGDVHCSKVRSIGLIIWAI